MGLEYIVIVVDFVVFGEWVCIIFNGIDEMVDFGIVISYV